MGEYENNEVTEKMLCSNCGAELDANQMFCSKCGVSREENKRNICNNCGGEVEEGQKFCGKCGNKLETVYVVEAVKPKRNKKPILIMAVIVAVFVVLIGVGVILIGPSVEEVSIEMEEAELKVDDVEKIEYNILPEEASDKKATWISSDEDVAVVDENGEVKAISEGSCIITVQVDGKEDTLSIIVKNGPDFKAIYDEYCNSSWASVGTDGSYLSVDTNPSNRDDYMNYTAYGALEKIHAALGLPESLLQDMGQTTALMGKQTEEFKDLGIVVSWSYHPDNGLEVTYKEY